MKHLILTLLCAVLFACGQMAPHPLALLLACLTLICLGFMFSYVQYRSDIIMIAVPIDGIKWGHLDAMAEREDMGIYVSSVHGIRPASGAYVARYEGTKVLIIETGVQ